MHTSPAARHPPQPGGLPPAPYRTAPWYDPRDEHLPCCCPHCLGQARGKGRSGQIAGVVLTVIGGILLPLVSVWVNSELHVVELGSLGLVVVALSAISTLLHLLLSPVRRNRETGLRWPRPPRTLGLRFLLLVLALFSCLTWGYLALLFLPLLPISVVALIFFGLGLCGLCPTFALTVALFQVVRDARALSAGAQLRLSQDSPDALERAQARERWEQLRGLSPLWVSATVVASLLVPLAGAAALGGYRAHQRAQISSALEQIDNLPPYSETWARAIAELHGSEDSLIDRYLSAPSRAEQEALATIYLRLTDAADFNTRVERRGRLRGRASIRPYWFLSGDKPFHHSRWGF